MNKYLPAPTNDEMYELFSVLIASGGAMGGHYFSYIKSFENGKWYNFNDSTVTPIEEKEIEKMFGEDDDSKPEENKDTDPKPKPKPVKKGYGTSAYMLMYRKVGPNNCSAVTESEIAEYLREEIIKENEEFKESREKYIKRKDELTLRVHYQLQDKKSVVIKLHKNETLRTAIVRYL
jgi:ubiquitin carboxyl-terminal hydrolase 47